MFTHLVHFKKSQISGFSATRSPPAVQMPPNLSQSLLAVDKQEPCNCTATRCHYPSERSDPLTSYHAAEPSSLFSPSRGFPYPPHFCSLWMGSHVRDVPSPPTLPRHDDIKPVVFLPLMVVSFSLTPKALRPPTKDAKELRANVTEMSGTIPKTEDKNKMDLRCPYHDSLWVFLIPGSK